MIPNNCRVPTTRPTIPAKVRTAQRAVSLDSHPDVFVFFTVVINTFASIIAPIEMFTIPPIKFAI